MRTLRERQGMGTRELARAIGYTTHSYISEVEAGKKLPSRKLISEIARLFNVSYDQLLDDDKELD
ncbi:MAG: helix-turn-helix domain-containing protein [Gammaproteobacteria bacterium]|nr:helix-turn-helix domain-containing protein [Gammaproteobacteria bacterium]